MRGRTKCSPALDRMAREGLRFTQGYANSSVCSPTRFALMTGRWQHRLRGGADEPIRSAPPRRPAPRAAARAPDAAFAAARRGLRHRAGRQMAPRLPAAFRAAEERLPGILRLAARAAWTTSRTATPRGVHDLFEGEREVDPQGLSHRPDLRARSGIRRASGQRAVPALGALQRAALALGDARRRRRVAKRIEQIYHFDGGSLATYLTMIRHMDEGIGRILVRAEISSESKKTRSSSSPATTAASASPTPGRWWARRWTCSRAASACPTSCAGRRR